MAVQVHLADDTVSVYEAPVRNSGVVGGPFASRRRVRNPAKGAWYEPREFFVGATITIAARGFRLTEADEATLNVSAWSLLECESACLRRRKWRAKGSIGRCPMSNLC